MYHPSLPSSLLLLLADSFLWRKGHNFHFMSKMAFAKLQVVVAALALAVSASQPQLQHALQPHQQLKPLVDSSEIQALVEQKNLLERAEDLYHVAELSIPEYGHPTRVIGSQGMNVLFI